MNVIRLDEGLAVRLPGDVVLALGLAEGDEVEVTDPPATGGAIGREETFEEFRARLEKFRGGLPTNYKFDREEGESPIASTATSCSTSPSMIRISAGVPIAYSGRGRDQRSGDERDRRRAAP